MTDAPESLGRAVHEDHAQAIFICPPVRAHLWLHRQHRLWRREAGGQLFGSISAESISVTHATGPYRGDERGRHYYRSHPDRAQAAIDSQAAVGRLYLGEWHTHPEVRPTPSREDETTFRTLVRRSNVRASALLLLIQGVSESEDGLAVCTSDGYYLRRWSVSLRHTEADDATSMRSALFP